MSCRAFAVAGLVLGLAVTGCAPSGTPDDERAALVAGAGRTEGGADQIDPGPTGARTPVGGRPWEQEAAQRCGEAVGPRFEQVAQSRDRHGVTTFWVDGEDWRLCDVADGDPLTRPVVLGPVPGPDGFDVGSLGVRTTPVEGRQGSVRVVAGGELPWRVDELTYRFPGRREVRARFVASEEDASRVFWVVTHTPSSGPLVDGPRRRGEVLISVVGAAAEGFRVPWRKLQRTE
jgi:hypothetical protein